MVRRTGRVANNTPAAQIPILSPLTRDFFHPDADSSSEFENPTGPCISRDEALNLFGFSAFYFQRANVAVADSHLLNAARQQTPEAWNTLLKRFQLPLYTYAAEFLQDKTTALDIVQETFVRAVHNIGSLRQDARFSSWLFSIAHQQCLQHWRRANRATAIFSDEPSGFESSDDFPDGNELDPRATLIRREESDVFFSLVEQLPDFQRSALLLHVLEDFSLEEIAAITEVPVGTVKSRLYHAKRALRELVRNSS